MRPTSAPAHELSETELVPVLDAALAHLSNADRSAILLRYLEQKSVDEVSQSLGVSSETAQKRISRAIARLRKLLGVGEPALPASSLAAFFATHGQCPVPQVLLHQITTLPAAAATAGISTTAATISKGVVKTMLWLKIKLIGAATLATLAIGATGTLVAQQALAPSRPPATAPSTALAGSVSGVTVEAMALAIANDQTAAPWKPDGSPEPPLGMNPPFAPFSPSPNMKHRTVVLCITSALPDVPGVRPASAMGGLAPGAWMPPSWVAGQLRGHLEVIAPTTLQSATLRVEVAAGPWETRLSNPPSAPAVDAFISNGIVTDRGTIYVISDTQHAGETHRVIGIDKSGKQHTATYAGDTNSNHLAQIIARFPDLRPEDLKEVRYETRPYTDFVEFSDVALDPGVSTKPQVRTGKINPSIIAADNPGDVGEYYVGGHVKRVGVYSLTARQITLKQAIVSAGMTDQPMEQMQVDLIRRLPGNQERITTIDLDPVFSGTQPDWYLQPNDVIQVRTKTPTTAPANPK